MKKNNMTKTLLLLVIALGMNVSALMAQNVGVNTDTPKATLDVQADATNANALDGIIAPRLTAEQLNAKTYTAEQTGAMVYVTAALPAGVTATAQLADVNEPGQYLFNGTKWVKSAGQNGAEWVAQGDSLVLKRSGQGTFPNKVYYDKNGLYRNASRTEFLRYSMENFEPTKIAGSTSKEAVWIDSKNIKYSTRTFSGTTFLDKRFGERRLLINETNNLSGNKRFSLFSNSIIVEKDNLLDYNRILGVSSDARHFGKGDVTYLDGMDGSATVVEGSVSARMQGIRSGVTIYTPEYVNQAFGYGSYVAVKQAEANDVSNFYGHIAYTGSTPKVKNSYNIRLNQTVYNTADVEIENAAGLRYDGFISSVDTALRVKNNYGVYINDVTEGSVSNHAIYTHAGKNSFGDTLQVRNINTIVSDTAIDKVVVADADGVFKTKDAATLMAEVGEWVAQGDSFVLKRSGQGDFSNKVYYDKNGGYKNISEGVSYDWMTEDSVITLSLEQSAASYFNYQGLSSTDVPSYTDITGQKYKKRVNVSKSILDKSDNLFGFYHSSSGISIPLSNPNNYEQVYTGITGIDAQGTGRIKYLIGAFNYADIRNTQSVSAYGTGSLSTLAHASNGICNELSAGYIRSYLMGTETTGRINKLYTLRLESGLDHRQESTLIKDVRGISNVISSNSINTGTGNSIIGLYNEITHEGQTAYDNLYGSYTDIKINGTEVVAPKHVYGVLVQDVAGGSESNHAIYTKAGRVSFGDVLQLRATRTPSSSTDVLATDKEGDVIRDSSNIYILTKDSNGVLKWGKTPLNLSW